MNSVSATPSRSTRASVRPYLHLHLPLSLFLSCGSLLLTMLAPGMMAQTVSISPVGISFSGQPLGTTSAGKTVTLKNTSTTTTLKITSIVASGEFADTTTCTSTLAAGASCTVSVTSTPATLGTIDGAITFTDNATPGTQVVDLTGKGLAPVTLSPATEIFPSTAIGKTSAAKNITLTNSTVALTMGAVTVSGDFSISANTCTGTIAASKTCTISVTFTPSVSGAIVGALTIADSGAGSPQVEPLTGTGTGTVTNTVSLSPTSLTFASQATGSSSASQSVTLTNSGTATLAISSVSASGDYAESDTCAGKSVAAGKTCVIKVTFKPTAAGSIKGAISIVDAAVTSPQVEALTGTGVSPLTFSPAALAFTGTVGVVGTAETATLTNNSSATIKVSKVAVSGDYTETNTCGSSIAAGKSCTFSVTFAPLVTGTIDGGVTLTASGIAAPQVLSLSGTTIAATTAARYAYDVQADAASKAALIVGYSVNPTTGYIRPLTSTAPPSDNFGIVVDPFNKFLYVPDGPQIEGYSIGVDGSLKALAGSPFNQVGGSTLIFSPNGKFAYCNLGYEYSLNSTTGALTQIAIANTGGTPYDVAINATGTFVYIANHGDSTISAYSVNQTTGALTEISGSPFSAGVQPYADVVSPNGKFLFVSTASSGTDGLTSVFGINASTGALTPVSGSPFSTPGGGFGIVTDLASKFLFEGGVNLGAYAINGTTGALSVVSGSPYTLPAAANAVSIDPSGKFLYVPILAASNSSSIPGLLTYSINGTTGALTKIFASGADGNQVEALAIASGSAPVIYTPKFAYVANQGSKSISEWTINDATGALTAVSGSPIGDTNGPQLVAAAPSGTFVYTGNSNNSVSEYSVKVTTGALTLVSGSPLKGFGSVNALAVDPTGSYLLVLDSSKQVLDSYSISSKTGALTALSNVSVPANSLSMTLDATGAVAVVTSATNINTYQLSNGTLTVYDSMASTTVLTGATVDQSGQYILGNDSAGNAAVTYSLFPAVQLSSTTTGNKPSAVLAEPSGKYVYVANQGDGTISAYSVNNSTGALKQIGSAVSAAAGTSALSTSNDGKYLYAVNTTAGSISIFTINSNGSLTSAGTATSGTSPSSIATTGTNQ